VLIPPATLALTTLAYRLAGTPGDQLVGAVARGWPLLLAHYALQAAVIGLGEELGWRGWLLPALLRTHSRAGASARVAAVWGLWHLPALLQGGGGFALSFAALTAALSFLFTALWARTRGSVLAVALAHGAVNAPQVFLESALGASPTGTTGDASTAAWYAACALYGAVAVLVVVPRWRWWSRPGAVPLDFSAAA
jgi:membrane protease YdiL (CAAX protease family)